jgi:hypothetical protein
VSATPQSRVTWMLASANSLQQLQRTDKAWIRVRPRHSLASSNWKWWSHLLRRREVSRVWTSGQVARWRSLLEITRHGSSGYCTHTGGLTVVLNLEAAPTSWKKRLGRGSCMEEERQWSIPPLQHHGDRTLSIWFSSTSQAVNVSSCAPFIGAGGRGPLPLI